MVTNETRNNMMILVLVIAVGVLVFYFMFSFSETMEKAANESGRVVNETATNVTQTFREVLSLITEQNKLQEEQRNESRNNLALFLNTFANQSAAEVNATNEMREEVIETLQQSQNLTMVSQNLTSQRIAVETETNEKLDSLILKMDQENNTTDNNNQTTTT